MSSRKTSLTCGAAIKAAVIASKNLDTQCKESTSSTCPSSIAVFKVAAGALDKACQNNKSL